MALPHFTAQEPAAPSTQRWWLSLYPRLSAAAKRSLLIVCLSAALLVNSELKIINWQRPGDNSQFAYTNSAFALPVVQNALLQLNLPPRDPIGDQFQVNSYTTGTQRHPDVALDSDGDFVVVWHSNGSSGGDTSGYSIQGQRYNSIGVSQGSQFQVNSYTTDNQLNSMVALDSDGDFVVVWQSWGSSSGDTSAYSIQGQRYNSAGTAQGSQFQVNSYTTDHQVTPVVSLDSDGNFVVVWASNGSSGGDTSGNSIHMQQYNSVGTAQGSQFQVNSYTTGSQNYPSVALDSNGDFVVVWDSNGSSSSDTSSYSIQGQRYNSDGTAQGSQFQVNSYTTNRQDIPAVAMDSDGDFVAVWQSYGSSSGDTSGNSIQGQRYNSAGTAQGSQFQVNSYTTLAQRWPAVALDSNGDFVVVWQSDGSSGGDTNTFSIQGQGYNSAGTSQGSQFQVNSYTTNGQFLPAVSLDSGGDFVIIWDSNGSSSGDTSGYSIQGQRFTTLNPTPTPTPTFTPTPSDTPTFTPTPSDTPTFTPTPSDTPTFTPTPSDTPTFTPTPSDTPTFTPTPSDTPTFTPTPTGTPTPTATSPAVPPTRAIYLPAIIGEEFPYFEGPCEDEPNDSVAEANGYLRSGQSYCGYPDDTRDFFKVYLFNAGTISADLTGHTGDGVQLQLFYQSTDNLVDFDSGAGSLHVEYNGPAGLYYLYIFTLSGHNSTTPYSLVVNYP
jgi:hypothetical protein